MGESEAKVYILDTNVLLHEPLSIYSFQEHDVVIPMTVLEELDQIKDRKKDVSREARVAIRAIDDALKDASPEEITKGVPLINKKGGSDVSGLLSIFPDHALPPVDTMLPGGANDNLIINTALHLQTLCAPKRVVLVTKDINMRLKAKGAGMQHVEDYRTDQLIDDVQFLSTGFRNVEGDFWDQVGEVETFSEGRDTFQRVPASLLPNTYPNEYILDSTATFAARVEQTLGDRVTLHDFGRERLMGRQAWGVHPKNIYQALAMDALLDPTLDLVILTGPAGSGKTLLTLASALELVVEKGIYSKIIVTRNTPEIAESIGFLPGTEEEKMAPWLGAITDTLEVLHRHDESMDGTTQYIMDKANIQFKSVNFMRGRSIQNTLVILDESQNLTASQLKTIITRCGEGTKIICSGNLAQIDSNYLSPVTSGLTYIVERFKSFEGSAHVYLNGVVRSRLASFAEENL